MPPKEAKSEPKRKCAGCLSSMVESSFTGSQLKKKGARRCMVCVSGGVMNNKPATSATPPTAEVKKHQGVGGEKTTTQQAAPTTAGGGGGAEEKKVTAAKDYLLQYYHHIGCVCQGTSGTDSDKKKTLKLFVDKNDDSKRTFTLVEDEDSSTDDGAWGHVDTYTGTWCGNSSGTEQKNLKLQVELTFDPTYTHVETSNGYGGSRSDSETADCEKGKKMSFDVESELLAKGKNKHWTAELGRVRHMTEVESHDGNEDEFMRVLRKSM